MHSFHRWLGTALGLLVAGWFASGAVMLFVGYPRFGSLERVALAPALSRQPLPPAPTDVAAWLTGRAAAGGARLRLSMLEERPTWTFTDAGGERRAVRADDGEVVAPLDAARARAEIERRLKLQVTAIHSLDKADQWTLARANLELLPLWHATLIDDVHTEAYISAKTGELAMVTTRAERVGAWFGAIPHWIYPAILVRERALWSNSVIVLALVGLVLTLTGLAAGVHSWLLSRKRARAGTQSRARNTYLLWHQRIGLWFGLLASSWLLSGALSLEPFDWTGPGPSDVAIAALHGQPRDAAAALQQLTAAVHGCQRALELREVELFSFGQRVYASCVGPAETRVIDLLDPALDPKRFVSDAQLASVARKLSGDQHARVSLMERPDDFYYPTHARNDYVDRYLRIELSDEQGSTYYLDPARPRLLQYSSQRKRLERWLYNGLHSWDFAWLYRWPTVWRSVLVIAMLAGLALSVLGLALPIARTLRRRRAPAQAKKPAQAVLDSH